MTDEADAASRIRVGASACLLGERVRYDGGDKRDRNVTEVLAAIFELVPVCPEVEVGMGTPREPVHLAGDPARPRMLTVTTRADWTERMARWAEERVEALARAGIDGYVLKARSPSCGLAAIPVHAADGSVTAEGSGLFARALAARMPELPLIEEARLGEEPARERFVAAVRAHHARRTANEM